jgi:hypothetical protein
MGLPQHDPRLDDEDEEFEGEEEQEVREGGASPAGDSRLAALVNEVTLDAVRLRLALLVGVSEEAARDIQPLLVAMYEALDALPTDRRVTRRVGFRA